MSPPIKLLCIGFAAPALAFALVSTVWSFVFLFLAILGYPIMVVVTLALIYPLHLFFVARRVIPVLQLPLILLVAAAGGFAVYVALFGNAIFGRHVFSVRLALEYSSLGVVAGICAWLLYNFGPLKLSRERSNPMIETDHLAAGLRPPPNGRSS